MFYLKYDAQTVQSIAVRFSLAKCLADWKNYFCLLISASVHAPQNTSYTSGKNTALCLNFSDKL